MVILMFYVLAGLIRLAWFNVTEECRQKETDEKRACYQGLPITSMAIILPLVVVFRPLLGKEFMVALHEKAEKCNTGSAGSNSGSRST